MKTYFLTGATGAIGSALVPVLLEDKEVRVRLLIRAKSHDELAARLGGLFDFWGIGAQDADFRQRVQAVGGDTTLVNLGLEDSELSRLRAECTHIIHAAGIVRMNLPIEDARKSAVGAARNIIALARGCQSLEKIDFVSTVGVGGRWPGTVPERWLSEPRLFHNTYEQAKAEAEDYLHEDVVRGSPLTIHRPSMVVGDSRTGRIIHFQVFYHLCEFLSGRRTLGLSPELGSARIDIVPADYVAKAIAWSSGQSDTTGRILHLCSGEAMAPTIKEVRRKARETFSRAGLALPPAIDLPVVLFRALVGMLGLVAPKETRRAIRTLPVFLDYLATEQYFDSTATRELLNGVPLALPSPEDYLDAVLGYYLERSFRH